MSKLSVIGIVFIAAGFVSGLIQKKYYGYMDAEGVIHDSLFLPLTFILLIIGSLLVLISMLRFLIRKFGK